MNRKVTVKIPKIFIFIIAFLFLLIIIKLSYVALSPKVNGINLREFAKNRNTKEKIIHAKRGNILDKDGNNLASVVNSYTLIAYLDENRTTNPKKPQHVIDKAKTAQMLNEQLGIDYDFALKQLNKKAYQVEFGKKGKNLNETTKNKIKALEVPGIDFINSHKRTYSMGAFASYLIGYAKNKDDGKIVGELGIESFYDKELSGKDGKIIYQTDAYGYTLPSAEVIKENSVDGNDIYLTIDSNIQLFAENLVKKLTDDYKMEWLTFSVMDAKSGAIVASSTYPNFDPNNLNTISSYMNPLISYSYEPGSVMKIFAFASSMEEGLYQGDKKYKSGKIKVADTTINDFIKSGWGEITYDKGFAYSSNVAASKLALSLGVANLTDYYHKLGFGKKTGIELANEVDGEVSFKYESELATASFGQGKITVTPIQMLQALSFITNEGVVIKPYIVDKIVNQDGKTIYTGKRQEVNNIYSLKTTNHMHKLMYDAVYNGLSKLWQPEKTTIIGKTGTAQIASKKGYLEGNNDYIRSFAGIFPEEDPKYILYFAVKQINTGPANLSKQVTKAIDDIVSYMGLIENENIINKKIIVLNNYISEEVNTIKEILKDKKLNIYTLGKGNYIINQYPLKDTKVFENSKLFLLTNNNEYMMENLIGWSLNEVQTYANLLKIKLITDGYGFVTSQSIAPGTNITKDMVLNITLSDNESES